MKATKEIELSVKEARAALTNVEFRIKETAEDRDVEIFYDGKWRTLGRMDSCDEVRSTIGYTSDKLFYKDPVKYYRSKIMMGAVVSEDGFFVIDSATDG